MKTRNRKSSIFDKALREATRDLAREMGYKTDSRYTPGESTHPAKSRISMMLDLFKTKSMSDGNDRTKRA
jgi:hypothetical protein